MQRVASVLSLAVAGYCLVAGSATAADSASGQDVTVEHKARAARFLNQATCGATQEEIDSLAIELQAKPETALADWIGREVARPITGRDLVLDSFRRFFPPDYPNYGYRQRVQEANALRAGMMIDSPLQLRTRMAYALGQIFVVSNQGDLNGAPEGMCDWQDMLFKNAFGRFDDLLMNVTTHPCMGYFLSSAGNAKAKFLSSNSRPDENYAREVMQLFTIGLYELKPDGSYAVKAGSLVPTYDNDDITELARVFTGMIYPKGPVERMKRDRKARTMTVFINPNGNVRYGAMMFDERRHDDGAKKFLDGRRLPPRRPAEEEIRDVIDRLSVHPSTAPFISRALIQRFVTSNPSPAYVRAVADVFRKTGGDLKEVLTAILLHPEARTPDRAKAETAGKLREPWLRFTHMARAFRAKPSADPPWFATYQRRLLSTLGQFPLASPSVFNFYMPSYEPPGEITERNESVPLTELPLVGPEFQILHATTAVMTPNHLLEVVDAEERRRPGKHSMVLDLGPQVALADRPQELLQNIDLLLTGGAMSDSTREIILKAVNAVPDGSVAALRERAKLAVYLAMISPDYVIQR
ncbi:MAG: DUF1800 domain-containing protein [Chthoniobacterales bacterium]|nr:DUF1800 domain-containing protein [Chthoniobacterales bacterium]